MKKSNLLLLFLIFLNPLFGQQYNTDYIIQKADSILKVTVGDSIYQYFKYNSKSYYEYVNRFDKTKWETLDKKEETKGEFVEVDVRFYLDYPPKEEVTGTAHIQFDKYLFLRDTIKLDFIPSFLWKNRKCDFISSTTAIEVAQDSIVRKGLYDISAYLEYDIFIKKYIYTISNVLTEKLDFAGNKNGDVEMLIIDAITGEILDYNISWYGTVY